MPVATTPMMTSTTITSMRVKPAVRACRGWRGWRMEGLQAPGADVGIKAFAAGGAIGAQAHYVHLALEAGDHVLVGLAPGVHGQLVEVVLPVVGYRGGGGLDHQGLEA